MYFSESLHAVYHGSPRPQPPALLEVVAGARDRREAFSHICPRGATLSLPVDLEALIERGEFVPRRLVTSEDDDGGVDIT
jgi:hypothetical protein